MTRMVPMTYPQSDKVADIELLPDQVPAFESVGWKRKVVDPDSPPALLPPVAQSSLDEPDGEPADGVEELGAGTGADDQADDQADEPVDEAPDDGDQADEVDAEQTSEQVPASGRRRGGARARRDSPANTDHTEADAGGADAADSDDHEGV